MVIFFFFFGIYVCGSITSTKAVSAILFKAYLDIALITENWKHGNKIIFKCVNSIVGPNFEVVFAEKSTCRSRKQCTGSIGKHGMQLKSAFQHYPNIHLGFV